MAPKVAPSANAVVTAAASSSATTASPVSGKEAVTASRIASAQLEPIAHSDACSTASRRTPVASPSSAAVWYEAIFCRVLARVLIARVENIFCRVREREPPPTVFIFAAHKSNKMIVVEPVAGNGPKEQRARLVARLHAHLCRSHKGDPAVFDIDNTLIHGNGRGALVEEILYLVVYCVHRGTPVFFVTARPEETRAGTAGDLRRWFRSLLTKDEIKALVANLLLSKTDDPHKDKRLNHQLALDRAREMPINSRRKASVKLAIRVGDTLWDVVSYTSARVPAALRALDDARTHGAHVIVDAKRPELGVGGLVPLPTK